MIELDRLILIISNLDIDSEAKIPQEKRLKKNSSQLEVVIPKICCELREAELGKKRLTYQWLSLKSYEISGYWKKVAVLVATEENQSCR